MKIEIKQKDVRSSWEYLVLVCGNPLYHLVRGEETIFYNAGKYGWNCDIYASGNIAIIQGGRSFGNIDTRQEENVWILELLKKGEQKAKEIYHGGEYNTQQERVHHLFCEICDAIYNNFNK